MKRTGNLFPGILEWANLQLAVWRAARGKRQRDEVVRFLHDCDGNLRRIQTELGGHTFSFGNYRQFPICDPKPRIITAPSFPERIVHHAIINVCEPYFERFLIDQTYACRKNRGRIKAVEQAHAYSRRYRWFLQLDIRSYFDSICHSILLRQLGMRFKDADLLRTFGRVIHSFQTTPGTGLPIGSLTSQHFANFYLGWLDHFVKHELRCRGYVRYMDDFVLWDDSHAALVESRTAIESFLDSQLGLRLKRVPQVQPVTAGLNFLGCQVFPSHVCLNRRNRRRVAEEIRRIEGLLAGHQSAHLAHQLRLTTLINFASQATTVRLRW